MDNETDSPRRLDSGRVVCHGCGRDFERVGGHWAQSDCEYPAIDPYDMELLTGLMMGDGTLRTQSGNPFVQIYLINQEFLEWLDEQLGWLSTGVSLYRTARKSVDLARQGGYNPNAQVKNYNDVYQVRTRSMPQFDCFREWYDQDGKKFPQDLELTPTKLACWYACDGSLNFDDRAPESRPYMTLSVKSLMDQSGKLVRMMQVGPGANPRVDENTLRLTVDGTARTFEWMAGPLPGFEYKWETENYSLYQRRKAELYATSTPWVGDIDSKL